MATVIEGLVQSVCSEQGLQDIAPFGTASQSSVSKWSCKNDAQRAVQDIGDVEFAFHTDKDVPAWWRLDLGRVHFPELICIENRRTGQFWQVSSRIRVRVSEDGTDWITLHEGDLAFGTYRDGFPLILPLAGKYPVRYLRIENTSETYLHLRSVKVLAPARMHLTFAANRTDGLGERLKAMVNGIALARYFDGRFAFSWKPMSTSVTSAHAIGKPQEIFSQEFVEKHLEDVAPDMGAKQFFKGNTAAYLEKAAQTGGLCIDVPQNSLRSLDPELAGHISPEDLTAAFWEIAFSEKMQKAVALAQTIDFPETSVGLHLRAGDIVYGRYRYNSRYLGKVVPYPLALRFIEMQNATGNRIVLFGQDADMCRWMAQEHNAIFAGDLHARHGFDVHQAALFDIILMSRCAKVVAGNSGFSQIAHLIGRFETLDPVGLFAPEEALRILRAELSVTDTSPAIHALQQAFACNYAVNMLSSEVSDEDTVSLLRMARQLDPDNAFYCVLLSIALFRLGDLDGARQVLDEATEREAGRSRFGTLAELASTQHPDGSMPLDRRLGALEEMAGAGIAPASAILALYHWHKKNVAASKRWRGRYLDTVPVPNAFAANLDPIPAD